jgi:hypothetical protein
MHFRSKFIEPTGWHLSENARVMPWESMRVCVTCVLSVEVKPGFTARPLGRPCPGSFRLRLHLGFHPWSEGRLNIRPSAGSSIRDDFGDAEQRLQT